MNNYSLTQFRDLAYDSAKENGFYTNNQDDDAYVAAIHGELSEAFDAWNKNIGWYIPFVGKNKPEGVIFELVDAVIRALSYCGYKGFPLKYTDVILDRPYLKSDLCDVILKSHLELSQYYDIMNRETRDDYEYRLLINCSSNIFSNFISRIDRFISDTCETPMDALIDQKLVFNSARGLLHGGHKV